LTNKLIAFILYLKFKHKEAAMLLITLKEYLARIERLERAKPVEMRRKAPTMTAIARESGVSFVTINRLANGRSKHLNLQTGSKIIEGVRRLGFQMNSEDLITFSPSEAR